MKRFFSVLLFLGLLIGQAIPAFAQVTLDAEQLIASSKDQLGVKYKYGGTTTKGFDCSGFTTYIFKQFDVELPRSSRDQAKIGTEVKKGEWEVGDLLFFNTSGKGISHVAIYIGDNQMIHAGTKGIVIDDVIESSYYSKRYVGARRVANFEFKAVEEIIQPDGELVEQDLAFIMDTNSDAVNTDEANNQEETPEAINTTSN